MAWASGLFPRGLYDRRRADAPAAAGSNGLGPREAHFHGDRVSAIPVSIDGPREASAQEEYSAEGASGESAPVDRRNGQEPAAPSGYVLNDLLRGLEVSFGIEASQLEGAAIAHAREQAEKGLPRHDIPATQPVEIERTLARGAAEVFLNWSRRVRRRLEDALQRETSDIQALTIQLEDQLLRYRLDLDVARKAAHEVAVARADDALKAAEAAKLPKRRMSYLSGMTTVGFWVLMACLVFADFVANVPVFNELYPATSATEKALQAIELNASQSPFVAGLTAFLARIAIHPEASILAFSVILFLVFLADQLGGAVRTIVALHGAESKVSDDLLMHHKRRPRIPAWGSAFGIIAIILTLFLVRGRIEPAARARMLDTQAEVTRLAVQIDSARSAHDASRVEFLVNERQGQEGVLRSLQERHKYTQVISASNTPILLLNLALVVCAALAAYQRKSEVLEVEPPQSPGAELARLRFERARASVETQRQAVCGVMMRIEPAVARATHILHATPWADAEPKRQRLLRVVPRFRAENARARALDTRSIRAFDLPEATPELDFDSSPLRVPEGLTEVLAKADELKETFRALERERDAVTELAA